MIVDFSTAADRNYVVNEKKAKLMSIAMKLLISGIVLFAFTLIALNVLVISF